jgi:hypothetical protein
LTAGPNRDAITVEKLDMLVSPCASVAGKVSGPPASWGRFDPTAGRAEPAIEPDGSEGAAEADGDDVGPAEK